MPLSLRLFIAVALLLGYFKTAHAQITITSVSPNPICPGSTITVTYKSSQAGTVYTYLYSANSTDSGEPQQIQYIPASNDLFVTIPLATTQASGSYTIRLTSNTPTSATYTAASSVTITMAPPAPVVSNVSYCQNSNSQPLSATASAGGILNWYMTQTGGTSSSVAPTPPTSVVGSITFYVSQTVNGCEGPRATINVTVKAIPPAPTLTANVISLCQGSIAPALLATANSGGTLNWYTTSTGGFLSTVAPIPPTSQPGITIYYVSQTSNGCEGPRAPISVIVKATPTAPSTIPTLYCQGVTASPLIATASPGGTLNWYTTPTGGSVSSIAPTPPTSFVGSLMYYVSQTVNGCESPRSAISVVVQSLPVSPSVSSATYCQGSQASPLTAIASPGGTRYWYTSPTGGMGSLNTPIPPTLTPGTFTYYVSQSINFCEGPRAAIYVTILPKPTVSINAGEAILTPSHTSLTLTASTSIFALTWSTGETTPSIVISTTGAYSVTATDATSCSATATVSINQSNLDIVYSVKMGAWNDPTVWSTNQLPTSIDAVRLRHAVNLPEGYQAQAGLLRYDAGGQLHTDTGSQLLLGSYD